MICFTTELSGTGYGGLEDDDGSVCLVIIIIIDTVDEATEEVEGSYYEFMSHHCNFVTIRVLSYKKGQMRIDTRPLGPSVYGGFVARPLCLRFPPINVFNGQ